MPPDLPALPRFIKSVAKLRHRQNSGTTDVGQRQRINWVDTASATFAVAESDVNEEVTVSVTTLGAPPTGSASGDLTGSYPGPALAAIGSATGPLGSATVTPVVTIDTKGRVTALTSATIVPTNAAGGDLAGNYPNPTIATTTKPAGVAWGRVAFAKPATSDQGSLTTPADLTGMTVSFTAVANRYYRASGIGFWASDNAGDNAILTVIADGVSQTPVSYTTCNSSEFASAPFECVFTLSAGTRVVKLNGGRSTGSGNLTFGTSRGTNLLVEDIGPV